MASPPQMTTSHPASPPPPPVVDYLTWDELVALAPLPSGGLPPLTAGKKRVLVLYTGGTFGCKPDSGGRLSPVPEGTLLTDLCADFPTAFGGIVREDALATDPAAADAEVVWFGYAKALDSTNMTPNDWNKMAVAIEIRRSFYTGVVVVHGTDTMYYTASALSFMLPTLSIPVVVTGSQSPVYDAVTDAFGNFQGALQVLRQDPWCGARGSRSVPLTGVYIYFHFKLMLGARALKQNSHCFDAFTTPNMGVVGHAEVNGPHGFLLDTELLEKLYDQHSMAAQVGDDFRAVCARGDSAVVQWRHRQDLPHPALRLLTQRGSQGAIVQLAAQSVKVAVLRLGPHQVDTSLVESLARFDGIVLEAYGAGNAPEDICAQLAALRLDHNVPVAYVTECFAGGAASDYAVAIPRDAGVRCADMTLGCAYARMLVTLSLFHEVAPGGIPDGLPADYTVELPGFGAVPPSYIRDTVEGVMAVPMYQCFTPASDVQAHCRNIAGYRS